VYGYLRVRATRFQKSPEHFTNSLLVKKEREKAEKQKKFEEKQAKQKAAAPASAKAKEKKEKPKDEVSVADYVEETPKGQKKSESRQLMR
jgi:hypothetical protein